MACVLFTNVLLNTIRSFSTGCSLCDVQIRLLRQNLKSNGKPGFNDLEKKKHQSSDRADYPWVDFVIWSLCVEQCGGKKTETSHQRLLLLMQMRCEVFLTMQTLVNNKLFVWGRGSLFEYVNVTGGIYGGSEWGAGGEVGWGGGHMQWYCCLFSIKPVDDTGLALCITCVNSLLSLNDWQLTGFAVFSLGGTPCYFIACVKLKACGPDLAYWIILSGPWELTECVYLLRYVKCMWFCDLYHKQTSSLSSDVVFINGRFVCSHLFFIITILAILIYYSLKPHCPKSYLSLI